jgi:DNA repair exonuclease SbcCD ATPase subunit
MAPEPTDRSSEKAQLWGRAVSRSALGTLNLVVGGFGVLAAAAMHSLPVLALGGLAYAALVAWDLANPGTWRAAARPEEERAPRVELPSPSSLRDPQLQQAARGLDSAREELKRVMEESPAAIARYLDLSMTSAVELDERAARLVIRGEEIYRYLSTQDAGKVREEIRRLQAQADRTQDASAREQFQQAKASREQQLATLQELVDALDRVHANVARIVATAEGLPARVMHMRALDGQAIDALSGDVNQELDRMNQEVAAFEDTLKSLSVRMPA